MAKLMLKTSQDRLLVLAILGLVSLVQPFALKHNGAVKSIDRNDYRRSGRMQMIDDIDGSRPSEMAPGLSSAMSGFGSRKSLLQKWTLTSVASLALLGYNSGGQLTAHAADEATTIYENKDRGVQLSIPSNWNKFTQQLKDRRDIIVYTDPGNINTNVFITYTPVQGDFTSLGSLGGIENIAATICPPEQGELLKKAQVKNGYRFDYTVEVTGQPKRRLISVVGIDPLGYLITITAQSLDSDFGATEAMLDGVIKSAAFAKSKV